MRPEDAIAGWKHWSIQLSSQPVIVGKLGGGRSNRSFLLQSDMGKLVLRLNGSASLLPGSQRQFETIAWRQASNRGIAPPMVYSDENANYIVNQFIESKLPPLAKMGDELIRRAIDLLERCHQLEVDGPVIDYRLHIDTYWQQVESNELAVSTALLDQRQLIETALNNLASNNERRVLCHHDPIPANFVGDSHRLYLIDWEYAALGWPVMDFAALAVEWSIDNETISRKTGIPAQALEEAGTIYRHLCGLWNELTAPKSEGPPSN